MCNTPECLINPRPQRIQTNVPGTHPVDLFICPVCDTRKCDTCAVTVTARSASKCPNGHTLGDGKR